MGVVFLLRVLLIILGVSTLATIVGCGGSSGSPVPAVRDAGSTDPGQDARGNSVAFNLSGATATSSTRVTLTFDAPPDPAASIDITPQGTADPP